MAYQDERLPMLGDKEEEDNKKKSGGKAAITALQTAAAMAAMRQQQRAEQIRQEQKGYRMMSEGARSMGAGQADALSKLISAYKSALINPNLYGGIHG